MSAQMQPSQQDQRKKEAGEAAAQLVQDGMVVGRHRVHGGVCRGGARPQGEARRVAYRRDPHFRTNYRASQFAGNPAHYFCQAYAD